MTFNSRQIVVDLVRAGGCFEEEPTKPVAAIYSYWSEMANKECYAVFTESRWDDMATAPGASNVKLLWDGQQLTADGQAFLAGNEVSRPLVDFSGHGQEMDGVSADILRQHMDALSKRYRRW